MANSLKVAWINGMNIDRVHFEQQERYIERSINQKTIDIFENLYGVFDIEFQSEMLSQGKIESTGYQASALMELFLKHLMKIFYQNHWKLNQEYRQEL